jgi:Cu+-exporting ATPase
MWVVPYSSLRCFMVSYEVYPGSEVTWYIVLIMVFSTIIQFFMGFPFYIGAFKSVRGGSANMDVLVVLGTTSAWLYGVILIMMRFYGYGKATGSKNNHGHEAKKMEPHHAIHELVHNFEIAAGLITVILLGKYLESLSKKQTVDKLSSLASLKVTKAMLLDPASIALEEAGVETDVELIEIGDFIKIVNG